MSGHGIGTNIDWLVFYTGVEKIGGTDAKDWIFLKAFYGLIPVILTVTSGTFIDGVL